MITQDSYIAPYIGKRTHAHTTFNDSEKDSEQKIIIALEAFPSSGSYYQSRVGTTQNVVPKNTDSDLVINGLTVNMLYDEFWAKYNKQLLNNIINISANVMLPTSALSTLNMTKLKLYRNQNLLPKSIRMPISDHPQLSEAEFILIKNHNNMLDDSAISVQTPNRLRWLFVGSQTIDDLWASLVNTPYQYYQNLYGSPYDGLYYDKEMNLINPAAQHAVIAYIAKPTGEYELDFTDGIDKLYAHTPQVAGETSPPVIRYFTMKILMERKSYITGSSNPNGTFHDNYYIPFTNQQSTITYTSQSY
jgi:hypothetical protein